MAGSDILDVVMYNIYGESAAPASVRTRAAKELYDCLIKIQKAREWWFSRMTEMAGFSAGGSVPITTITAHLETITKVFLVVDSKNVPLQRIEQDFADQENFQSGPPAYYTEDVNKEHLGLYPIPEANGSINIVYRKNYFPDIVTTLQEAIEAYSAAPLNILQGYLEAITTARVCTILDYPEKATTFSDIALKELDILIAQNADYNKQGFTFQYNGV